MRGFGKLGVVGREGIMRGFGKLGVAAVALAVGAVGASDSFALQDDPMKPLLDMISIP